MVVGQGMTHLAFLAAAPGNNLFSAGMLTLFLISLCYAAGRIHQFYRQTGDRELAYRDGYNTATKSLFHIATRAHLAIRGHSAPEKPEPIRGAAQVNPNAGARTGRPKHRANDRHRADLAETRQMHYRDVVNRRRAS